MRPKNRDTFLAEALQLKVDKLETALREKEAQLAAFSGMHAMPIAKYDELIADLGETKKKLAEKEAELANVDRQNDRLRLGVERRAYDEVVRERDEARRERDRLAAILDEAQWRDIRLIIESSNELRAERDRLKAVADAALQYVDRGTLGNQHCLIEALKEAGYSMEEA